MNLARPVLEGCKRLRRLHLYCVAAQVIGDIVMCTLSRLSELKRSVDQNGWALVPSLISSGLWIACISELERASESTASKVRGGMRNAVRSAPSLQRVANAPNVVELAGTLLGAPPRLIRSTLFDKTPESNWKVAWHQDLTIAVRERREVEGFGPWTTKAGVCSVQPPVEVLESIITIRVHLDGSLDGNGPLRVAPGSHRLARIPETSIPSVVRRLGHRAVPVPAGGALIMRPLLLHASSPSENPSHRRVLHLDFSSIKLPGGLRWHAAA